MNKDCTLQYGSVLLKYNVMLSERKTLEIVVNPDKTVIVKAPQTVGLDYIQSSVRKRALWITQQIEYFAQFEPRTTPRQYVGGETHLYLGRQYRLKIIPAVKKLVTVKDKYIFIETPYTDSKAVKSLLQQWYKARAAVYFPKILAECKKNMPQIKGIEPVLHIRPLKIKWGSFSPNGRLTLNIRLIQAQKECIEYVVVHELCHCVYLNHSPYFYRLLARVMPDWERRKQKLEKSTA